MRPAGCEAEMLRSLAEMPFIDRTDLAAVTGWSRGAVHGAVAGLDKDGLCDAVTHATGLFPAAERFHLTTAGLERLADDEGMYPWRNCCAPIPSRTAGGASCWSAWTSWPSSTDCPPLYPTWPIPSGCAGTGRRLWTPP